MTDTNKEILQYKIGGLLYMPAFQKNIVEKIKNNSIDCLTSIAFCLEDSIRDEALQDAEETLKFILQDLKSLNKNLPLIFIRIRTPEHLQKIHAKYLNFTDIITGYILPKFDLTNAEKYSAAISDINDLREKPLYIMPIFETENISKTENLIEIKNLLESVQNFILNVRVGVNDLSNIYGLRCDINHTIYDIGVVRKILVDILAVFAKDYVVAGSVWNYFGDEKNTAWADGLKNELALDRLNGFIGKSAIHPSQLPYIFDSLKVSQADFEDAKQILNWDSDSSGVVKGSGRMNELKCHSKWAQKIKILGEIYGVQNDKNLV